VVVRRVVLPVVGFGVGVKSFGEDIHWAMLRGGRCKGCVERIAMQQLQTS
jgi:hypothetical protein